MRLLFVLEFYPPHMGGVEILFKTLCEGLVSKGHEVEVVTSSLPDAPGSEMINGVKVTRIKVPKRASRYFFTFLSIPYLLRVAGRYDVIHTTTYNGAPPAWFASRIRRKPCIITVHEVIGKDWKKLGMSGLSASLHRALEKMVLGLPYDRYVAVSYSTKKNLRTSGIKNNVYVVHNSVNHDVFNSRKFPGAKKRMREKLGIGKKDFVYAFFGRPGVSKGVEYLIRAMPWIRKNIPESKALFIMGKEPRARYEYMKGLLKENADGDAILHSPLPYNEIPEYLMAADVVVVPSLTEGFGFCAAEACSLGKPVIASNTTSLPEVVSGKFLLVPPKNPKAIAKAVSLVKEKKYMKTPPKKFTRKKFIDGYEKIYDSLMR